MSDTTPDSLPADLGDTGKELIAKFRAENAQLRAQLQKFEGINPDNFKAVTSELEQLKQQNAKLSQKVTTSEAQWQFYQSATGKIDPNYINLAWSDAQTKLQISDTGVQIGGKPIDVAIDDFITAYPRTAAVSQGSDLPRDKPIESGTSRIVSAGDFISNLDDIASGKVVIE